jgi:DNA-binding transcriptional ArsR family regulator
MADADCCDLLCLDVPLAERLRASRPPVERLEAAAEAAKALGDPTRLLVAVALRDGGELCVCDLAWVCERSDKLISHHARALRSAGLVASRRQGKMVLYGLTERGRAVLGVVLPAAAIGAEAQTEVIA